MDATQQRKCLDFFSRVALVSQRRFVDQLWSRYPEAADSTWESLGLFLEGYAFEREGRAAGFPAAAADVIAELRSLTLDPSDVWLRFSNKLGNVGLNIKNNPLAPKGTQGTDKNGKIFITNQKSAIELANEVGIPLVQWALRGLKENRAAEIHAKIREVTGVGEKIAALFLRDVACRYQVFPSSSRFLLQPVDTWVERSASLVGMAAGKNPAEFIFEIADKKGDEPERINQGMWYFGAEIAGSQYRLSQALPNLDKAEAWLKDHLDSLSRGANTFSILATAVRRVERIRWKIESKISNAFGATEADSG